MSGDLVTPVRMLALETSVQGIRDSFNEFATIDRPYAAELPNMLAVGASTAAPTASVLAAGAITENRDWAFSYFSTETGRETALSAVLQQNLVNQRITLTGPRSTRSDVDYVLLYTRITGGGDRAWRLAFQIAKPSSGTWSQVDNAMYVTYLGGEVPMEFTQLMTAPFRGGTKVREVTLWPADDLDPSTSAYWVFGLDFWHQAGTKPFYTIRQDTQVVGLRAKSPYRVPFWRQNQQGPMTRDLDLAVVEGDQVYFYRRGVGSVLPLPRLWAMVDVTREVP